MEYTFTSTETGRSETHELKDNAAAIKFLYQLPSNGRNFTITRADGAHVPNRGIAGV